MTSLRTIQLGLPCLAILFAGSALGCNSQGTATHRFDLFTERATQSSDIPAARFFLRIHAEAEPVTQRHPRYSQREPIATHHHMHPVI